MCPAPSTRKREKDSSVVCQKRREGEQSRDKERRRAAHWLKKASSFGESESRFSSRHLPPAHDENWSLHMYLGCPGVHLFFKNSSVSHTVILCRSITIDLKKQQIVGETGETQLCENSETRDQPVSRWVFVEAEDVSDYDHAEILIQ
eukprot:3309940-Rhodomonas_salina.2